MARGGYRPGAGRPKGSTKAAKTEAASASAASLTPLEYMLTVMRDAKADAARRDRMAIAAAPFVHGRASDVAKPGTKEQAQAAAVTAAAGTEWDGLLTTPAAPLQ